MRERMVSGFGNISFTSRTASQSGIIAPDCMAIAGQDAREAGLPAELQNLSLAAINPPQGNLITHVCRIFSWCEETGLDPRSASLSRMADFFIHLFDKGLALPTFRAYRSAIAVIHKGFDDGTIVSNAPTLTKLFKAFFLSRPPKRRLLPSCSLPKVLEALAAPPLSLWLRLRS